MKFKKKTHILTEILITTVIFLSSLAYRKQFIIFITSIFTKFVVSDWTIKVPIVAGVLFTVFTFAFYFLVILTITVW